jgi:hypothetical protein
MTTTAKAPKAPREKLTLRDSSDLLLAVGQWVEDNIDTLELNGGALPDDLAVLLDEIIASRVERAEAIVHKLDEFTGYATSAKATKDRAARRQKVWENTIAALKAYAQREIERGGGEPIKAPSATLRLQRNGQPAVECRFDNAQLCDFYDAQELTTREDGGLRVANHPLARFLSVERVATLDRKALGAAYEARREELDVEARATVSAWGIVADVPDEMLHAAARALSPDAFVVDDAVVVETARRLYVANHAQAALAAEFPGVTCVRGSHLRID